MRRSDAFLKRLGIARVNSIPTFLEALKLLHTIGPLAGGRLSSMSCSGGEASVMADTAEGRIVSFPKLSDTHRAAVKQALGPLVAVANPLDYHTFIWNDKPAMTAAFSAFVSDSFDLNMLVLDFPRNDRCADADWWTAVDAFEAALKANKAKGAIVTSMLENLPEKHAVDMVRRGIVPIHGIVEAFEAAEAAAFIGAAWKKPVAAAVAAASDGATGKDLTTPDEADAKSRLLAAGLAVPKGERACSPVEAVAAANSDRLSGGGQGAWRRPQIRTRRGEAQSERCRVGLHCSERPRQAWNRSLCRAHGCRRRRRTHRRRHA